MADKIRLGIIGANSQKGWASRTHLPAVAASPDFELTAVCTTRRESAEETRQKYGARLAFDDYRKMLDHPDLDAVVVSVKVPAHYEATMAALDAGKHVYTEWPLGRTTAEAEEMAKLAQAKGVRNMVGLQTRVNPGFLYAKRLVESGYVGEVVSCRASLIWGGMLQWPPEDFWQRRSELGANALTIGGGHIIDALSYVAGDFSHVSSVVSTQIKEWLEIDSGQMVEVTSPDTILVSGKLANGGVSSVHVAGAPWAGSGFSMEVYGMEGTLVASCDVSPTNYAVRLQGVRGGHSLEDLEVPEEYFFAPEGMPKGEPYNVGQMYQRFGQAILSREDCRPDFAAAVELHRLIDDIVQASEQGREVVVSSAG